MILQKNRKIRGNTVAVVLLASFLWSGCSSKQAFKYVADQEQGDMKQEVGKIEQTVQEFTEEVYQQVHSQVGANAVELRIYSLEDTVWKNQEGLDIVSNPDAVEVLVNKKRNLPQDYAPTDLIKPDIPFCFEGDHEKKYMREEAAKALEGLFEQAKNDGIALVGVSGYRSYERQEQIFQDQVRRKGLEEAGKVSAKPGQSEHQTGLAMDVSCASIGFQLIEKFGETKEGQWLQKNAYLHGYIIRYPEGMEDITGYAYEPWHIRYVGKELAAEIEDRNITLEEFFETQRQYVKKK